ncbi:hypothetical protein, partial [Pseudomonas syringae group genomosp. 7]|uniref:hypothetical protein n=1 Tax=Pseudomonas syringae group genomosp. 7 TaxID=251699 RepID=UPI0037702695
HYSSSPFFFFFYTYTSLLYSSVFGGFFSFLFGWVAVGVGVVWVGVVGGGGGGFGGVGIFVVVDEFGDRGGVVVCCVGWGWRGLLFAWGVGS